MAIAGLDLNKGNINIIGFHGFDNVFGLIGRIQPVRCKGDDQEFGIHIL